MTMHFLERAAERGPDGVEPNQLLLDVSASITHRQPRGSVSAIDRMFVVANTSKSVVWRIIVEGAPYNVLTSADHNAHVTLLTHEQMKTHRDVARGRACSLGHARRLQETAGLVGEGRQRSKRKGRR